MPGVWNALALARPRAGGNASQFQKVIFRRTLSRFNFVNSKSVPIHLFGGAILRPSRNKVKERSVDLLACGGRSHGLQLPVSRRAFEQFASCRISFLRGP